MEPECPPCPPCVSDYRKRRFQWSLFSAVLLVAIICLIWYAYHYSVYNTSEVFSLVDNEAYLIHNAHPEKQEAADRMAEIHERIIKLLRHLKTKYTDPSNPYYERVQFLLNNFNPDTLIENSPHNIRNFTSYTEDKGKTFCICLRQKFTPNGEFIDMNTVMFVVIHETSHLFTPIFGHDKPFWQNFKFLLGEAVEIGVYHPVDYTYNPIDYCGLPLNYNPYFDSAL